MFEIIFLLLTVQGLLCAPSNYYVDVENDAEIIEAAEPLPGTSNLHEKSIPVIRLQIPGGYLTGIKNLEEKKQLISPPLRGANNLSEKSMPIEALKKSCETDH